MSSYTIQQFADYVFHELGQLGAEDITSATASDTTAEAYLKNNTPMYQSVFRLVSGVITDTVLPYNLYRVDTMSGSGIRLATPLTLTGGSLCGSMGFSPGDRVLLACPPNSMTAWIIGAVPSPGDAYAPRTFVTFTDHFQVQDDILQSGPLKMLPDSTANYARNTPFQRQSCGEFFVGAPGGPKIFADPFMTFLAANDATGVWAFRDDAVLRVAGLNYQHITSGRFEERLNNNGEYIEYAGQVLNTWESYGYYRKPDKPIISFNKDWEQQEAPTAPYKLEYPEAKPFHRIVELGGWLGYGKQSHIIAPPTEEEDPRPCSLYGESGGKHKALSKISQLADGFVGIESARGVSIVKRSVMPALQRVARTDAPDSESEPAGDRDQYDFTHSNISFKAAPGYKVTNTSELMQSLMCISDYVNYTLNYKTFITQLFHKEEWYIPEENGLLDASFSLAAAISELKDKYLIELPRTYKLKLDDKEQEYYPVEAGIHLLPDGGVSIYDGYGGEIRMAGGQVTISAPGGVWLRSGKDINLWAGGNMHMRTRKHAELTASTGSVRIKAETNLAMLGGNDKKGGVVIESKSEESDIDFTEAGEAIQVGGILMKAGKGSITALSNTMCLRSGVAGNSGGMLLDAGRGNTLYTRSQSKIDYIEDTHTLAWMEPNTDTVMSTQVSNNGTFVLPGRMVSADGSCSIQGDLYVHGSIYTSNELIAESHVRSYGSVYGRQNVAGRVNQMEYDADAKKFWASIDNFMTHERGRKTSADDEQRKQFTNCTAKYFYADGCSANEDVINNAGFSFRTDEEMAVPSDFYVYADKWQTVCLAGVPWPEPKVETKQEQGQYPYPGTKFVEPHFVTQTMKLSDGNGIALNRTPNNNDPVAEYHKPEYNEPVVKPLNEYPIIN